MNRFARWLGGQLAEPRGVGGRVVALAMRIFNRRVLHASIAALGIRPGDAVLDLGCGAGDALPLLARLTDGAIYGVDHAPAMVALARRRLPRAIVFQAGFDRLPLPDASVDRILAVNVAYFWHDGAGVVAEMRRLLRPGGRIIVYVTDPAALARAGLDRTGTHRAIDRDTLAAILGPSARFQAIDAAPGVPGVIARLDA